MKHGSELAVDLRALLAAGKLDLPLLAKDYVKLNREVADGGSSDELLFGGGSGWARADEVHGAWCNLRDAFQNVLGRTAINLELVGAAIVHIEGLYEGEDHRAAGKVADVWGADRDKPSADVSNPGDKVLDSPLPGVAIAG